MAPARIQQSRGTAIPDTERKAVGYHAFIRRMRALSTLVALVCGLSTPPPWLIGAAHAATGYRDWMSINRPARDLQIILIDHGGWGGRGDRTITLTGNGVGTIVDPKGRPWEHLAPQISGLRFETSAFLALLDEFYQQRFFQLDDSYQAGYHVHRGDDGQVELELESVVDAGESELTVKMGAYAKTVRMIASPTFTPAYLLGLYQHVKALAETSGSK